MTTTLTFSESDHTYWLGDRRIPSVTQIMRQLSEDAYAGIRKDVLEEKAALGTAVHLCTELDDEGDLDDASVREEWKSYLVGWRLFRAQLRPVIEQSEQRLYHRTYLYAGTFDRVAIIDGRRTLIDIKTCSTIHAHVGIQLAAYQMLWEDNGGDKDIDRMAVQLRADGTYRCHPFNEVNHRAAFMGLLAINSWKQRYQK